MTASIISPLESTVESHIDSTSRLVRHVDVAISLLIVVSLILGGLFLAVIADHWLLKEGLSMTLRFGVFAALFAAAGLYFYWKVIPLFRYQINPVYTADLIEQDTPVFKNSLINWLLLRQERTEKKDSPDNSVNNRRGNDLMFEGIVRTAAAKVQTVPVGHAVDLHRLIVVGTFLAILLVIFFAYAAFSPKSPFASLARIMFPFSGIERPQAAQFRNVHPGDATVLQGETITISAEVISYSPDPIYLVFSTDDGQAVNQRIPMSLPEGKIAFETQFPPGKQGSERGFNSSVDYRIAQGKQGSESRSKQYRLEVLPAASVEVMSLQYKFPDYTGIPPETVEHGGDIRALEGTEVAVAVRSTLPLQEIDLVFDDNPANRVRMTITNAENTEAKGTFTLKMPFSHKSFAFRAMDTNGNASRRSGIYQIEVIPDQPPKVQWADTATNLREVAQLDVPLNKALQLPVQAEDPDFALRHLVFKAESPGKRIPDVALLNSPSSGPTEHKGQIKKTVTFSPADKRLAVGDTVEIFVEAKDTKLPEANVSTTRRIKINVIDPDATKNDPNEEREKEGKDDSEKDNNQQEGGNKPDEENPHHDNDSKEDQKEQTEGQDPNQDEHNPKEQEQEGKDNSEQDSQDQQDQQGMPGQGNQQEGEDGSSNGSVGNEPGEDGDKGSEEQSGGGDGNNQGEQGNNAADQQGSGGEGTQQNGGVQQDKGERKENETKSEYVGGERQKKNTDPLNPDTQDGDAMERIVDHMKQDGAFPGANPFLRNDNTFLRDDSLDPNSQNRSNEGNDPSNPKQSDQHSEGDPQNKQGEQDNNKPESGSKGQQDQQNCKPSEGEEQGSEGQQDQQDGKPSGGEEQGSEGSGGEKQPGQDGDGSSGGESGEKSQGNQQDAGNAQEPSQGDGGTGGGTRAEKQTTPDDPNLKYANEVTDLVLDYLENQLKDKPNEELLKRLGWTEDQLKQFYDKWQKMSQDGKQPQQRENGKNEWLEALKSVGLLPNQRRNALQGSQTMVRDRTRATETRRYEPPAALKDRAKNYNENIGK